MGSMGLHHIFLTLLVVGVLFPPQCWNFCTYKGNKICEGAVTKEMKTLLQVCEGGGLKYKKKEKVKKGYPLAGRDCSWYGENICDKAIVQDLHRWWFLSQCSNKKMRVVGRSWEEVVKDPRFKNSV